MILPSSPSHRQSRTPPLALALPFPIGRGPFTQVPAAKVRHSWLLCHIKRPITLWRLFLSPSLLSPLTRLFQYPRLNHPRCNHYPMVIQTHHFCPFPFQTTLQPSRPTENNSMTISSPEQPPLFSVGTGSLHLQVSLLITPHKKTHSDTLSKQWFPISIMVRSIIQPITCFFS